MAAKLKVTQVRSGIGKPEKQKVVLKGLGLSRPNRSRVLEDTAAIRGMIRKVQHLVRVEPADTAAPVHQGARARRGTGRGADTE